MVVLSIVDNWTGLLMLFFLFEVADRSTEPARSLFIHLFLRILRPTF